MPEYKAPGVYSENVEPDPHPIVGVSTTVTALVGFTSSGPETPTLLNSFADYAAAYGGTTSPGGYMSQAVQGFFDNGGTRLYVSRVYSASGSPSGWLEPLEAIDDISIVCCPDENSIAGMTAALVAHCEKMRYRIAVLAGPQGSDLENAPPADARSELAAYYAPWLVVADPCGGADLTVHPGGHIAGAIVRNDLERGVSKAPANLQILGITALERQFTEQQQDMLSQRGINLMRSFPGRGNLIWGARTTSADPEWKYVNIRRYLNYLEKSIENGLQWVTFENNGPALWSSVQQSVGQFSAERIHLGKPARGIPARCLLRTLRCHHHDAGRHRQRPTDLPGWSGAGVSGRIYRVPDRPMDRRCHVLARR